MTAPVPPALRVAAAVRLLQGALRGVGVVRVEGEVRGVRSVASGHLYFTLRDEEVEAALDAVLFRTAPPRSREAVRDGARVVCTARATVFPGRGRLQLEVDRVEPCGLGSRLEALARLKAKLEAEGLFAPARKRPLPRDPRSIGVVTSAEGAAIHDIVRVAFRRGPVHILLARAPVQGGAAAARLVRALDLLARAPVDAVILGRGGGSAEDLAAFDDEALARRVAAMPVPVVSAVGHETDFTLADLVADARAATPSQAAELLVPDEEERRLALRALGRRVVRAARGSLQLSRQRVRALSAELRSSAGFARAAALATDELELRLVEATRERLRRERSSTGTLERRIEAAHPRVVLAEERSAAARLSLRLDEAARRELARRRADTGALAARLGAISPLAVLARGYAIASTADGRVVRRAEDVGVGAELRVRLDRGSLRAAVLGVEGEEA